jgi:hydroxylysine kinase
MILWDMMHVARLRPLADLIDRPARRAAVLAWLDHFAAVTHPAASALPRQAIHNDLSPSNLLVDPVLRHDCDRRHRLRRSGGGARASTTLAVAASYFIRPEGDLVQQISEILHGAGPELGLLPEEVRLVPDLIRARLVTRILLSGWRARLFPENCVYILRSNLSAWEMWETLQGCDYGRHGGPPGKARQGRGRMIAGPKI